MTDAENKFWFDYSMKSPKYKNTFSMNKTTAEIK
jgi:hypothetical protein